jgi:hypothetical protein
MIITAKIKLIEKSVKSGWYTVVLTKMRKGQRIDIPIFFGQKFWGSIEHGNIRVGLRVDVTCFVYGKKQGDWWNTYCVAENWRPYVSGQARSREIVVKSTGEVFTKNGEW